MTDKNDKLGASFLAKIISRISFLDSFNNIREDLIQYLKACYSKDISTEVENALLRQFLLESIGYEIRCLWAENATFEPEFLRDPYVALKDRISYAESTFEEIKIHLDAFFVEINSVPKIQAMSDNLTNNSIQTFDDNNQDSTRMPPSSSVISRQLKLAVFKKDMMINCRKIFKELKFENNLDMYSAFSLLGIAIKKLINNDDLVIATLGSKLKFEKPLNSPWYKKSLLPKPKEDSSAVIENPLESINTIIQEISIKNLDKFCNSMIGYLIPNTIRRTIWSHRLLKRSPREHPIHLSLSKELFRRASIKGLSLAYIESNKSSEDNSTKYNNNSSLNSINPIKDLIFKLVSLFIHPPSSNVENTVNHLVKSKLNTVNENSSSVSGGESSNKNTEEIKDGADAILFKRVEHLVFAEYVLNGTLTHRSVAVSYLLLKTFPDESPISEVILRMYQRINDDCLPSEQFQRKYSVAATSQKVWTALLARDEELYYHLQKYITDPNDSHGNSEPSLNNLDVLKKGKFSRKSMITLLSAVNSFSSKGSTPLKNTNTSSSSDLQSTAATTTNTAADAAALTTSKSTSTSPKCYLFLRGWLETGFLSYLSEDAVFFIWDQIIMAGNEEAGGIVSSFELSITRICAIILNLLRNELLTQKENLVPFLKNACKRLSTKLIIQTYRDLFC